MNLGMLRHWIKDEKSFSFHKLIFGLPEEVIDLQIFLKKYSHLSDEYKFKATDIFNLCKILPLKPKTFVCKNILAIAEPFKYDKKFLEIFHFLYNASLLNKENFAIMLERPNAKLLYTLYCDPINKFLTPEAGVFDDILIFISKYGIWDKETISTLRILHDENQLTKNILNIFSKNHYPKQFANILNVLSESKCMNEKNITRILNHKHLHFNFPDIFNLLHSHHFHIHDDFLELLDKRDIFGDLEKALSMLLSANQCTYEILLILTENAYINDKKIALFNTFIDHSIFNKNLVAYICKNYSNEFDSIVKSLSEYKLLNSELTEKIMKQDTYFSDCTVYLNHLKKLNLLDQGLFELFLEHPDAEWRKNFLSVLDLFQPSPTLNDSDQIKSLFQLSSLNLERLYPILRELIQNKLFNPKSIDNALLLVAEKLPAALEYKLVDQVPIVLHGERKAIHFNNQCSIFIDKFESEIKSQKCERRKIITYDDDSLEDKNNDSSNKSKYTGGMGEVTKAYVVLDAKEPKFCVKKLDKNDLRVAKNEVKYHQLSGRESFYFVLNNNVHIVYPWLKEKALSEFSDKELLSISFAKRLQALISGFNAIAGLHIHLRIHGDIKPSNFIFNSSTLTMELIDFSGAHKKGARLPKGWFSFPYTDKYNDPRTFRDHFCKDVYSAGFIVQQLFPDIYNVNNHQNIHWSIAEKAIVQLVNNMMNNDARARCTIKNALEYCQTLLSKIDNLDDTFLSNLSNLLLHKPIKNLEDCFLKLT